MKSEYAPHTKCPECGLLFTPEAHDDLIKELRLKLQHDQVMEWCKAKLNDYVIGLEKQNARLREALEEIAKSSSGCECCTEGALNREELGDVARRVLKEGYNG